MKKGHCKVKCHSNKENQSTTPVDSQSKGMPGWHGKKGKKADIKGVHTGEPPCDKIFLDDVHVPLSNEAYTTVHLSASAINKGMASLKVKVDIGASRNVLPLCLFRYLCSDHNDKTGHPSSLNVSNTRLTAYDGTQIPLFGSLHGPIIWQPDSPSAQPLLVCSRHPWSCYPGAPIM